MNFGLDLLGLAKFQDIGIKEFPKGWALGVFSSTFGDVRTAVKRLIAKREPSTIRVHLSWKDRHDYSTKDFPAIEKEAKKWSNVVSNNPQVKWMFSGACEHLLSPKDALTLQGVVEGVLPSIKYVNCGKNQIAGAINEVHGNKAVKPNGPYNFSFDGSACVDSNVEALKKSFESSEVFFFWEPRFNGRWETTDTTPRPLRKGYPTSGFMRSIVALGEPCGAVSLPQGWLYKSHAENKGNGDQRAEMPVFICPHRAAAITLKDIDSHVIANCKYYDKYADGRFRYYAPDFGYRLSALARKRTGDPRCIVSIADLPFGSINPSFRYGEWR